MLRKSLVVSGVATLALVVACSHEQKKDEKTAAPARLAATDAPKKAPQPRAATAPEAAPAPVASRSGDDAIFFEFDSSLVREDDRPILQDLAKRVKSTPGSRIRIEGNCDERGTTEYNLALGQQRAEAARKYLQSLGVSASQIATTSWGSERPLATGHDESSWARNRRDDLKVQ